MIAAVWIVAPEVSGAERLRSIQRFGPPPGAKDAVFVELDGDWRGVLFSYPFTRLKVRTFHWNREQGRVRVDAVRPHAGKDTSRIQVFPNVRTDAGSEPLPPLVVSLRREPGDVPKLTLELEHASFRATDAQLRFMARRVPDWKDLVRTNEVANIPRGAKIRFAFGFEPRAGGDLPTRFSVSLCRAGRCEQVFAEEARAGEGQTGWRDREVSIAAHAGGPATLRFETTRSGEDSEDLPLFTVPTLYARETPKQPSTPSAANLLLISIDTLRADHLGTYGYARDTSPFIDRELAAKGTVFERCLSTATTTAPSHMSMFTGLPPAAHGVHGEDFLHVLGDGVSTLAEVLRRNGFQTGAVTENGAMGAFRGFDRGFVSYYENRNRKLAKRKLDFSGHIENTLHRSLAWLEQNRDTRFFLFVHTYQVHQPYVPPAAFEKFFEGDGVDPRHVRRLPRKWHPISYDREIRYTDTRLGEFLARARERGLLDDTIVVLVSDHGDQFMEHGAIGHGPHVYDEVLHVPLIVRGPGIARGRRVVEPVSLVDLMPTVLDWTGVGGEGAQGKSFARQAREGDVEARVEPAPIFSEARQGKSMYVTRKSVLASEIIQTPVFAIRVGDRKLIRNLVPAAPSESGGLRSGPRPIYQYFDLAQDPGEQNDLFRADDPEAARLRELLEDHIEQSAGDRDQPRHEIRPEADTADGLDADRREKLRALGYLE